jgi:hypothetical protein
VSALTLAGIKPIRKRRLPKGWTFCHLCECEQTPIAKGGKSMSRFDTYRNSFANARLTRSKTGVLEVALHTDGGTLVFNGHTHEQFVDLFHAIGSDPDIAS